jgi:hypothetical protein
MLGDSLERSNRRGRQAVNVQGRDEEDEIGLVRLPEKVRDTRLRPNGLMEMDHLDHPARLFEGVRESGRVSP